MEIQSAFSIALALFVEWWSQLLRKGRRGHDFT